MKILFSSWQAWALLSAAFAALTAIFAKIGIENVNSDFATFIRTIVILLAIGLMLLLTGNWQAPASVSGKSWLFLVLSGLATGASWLCYFRALKIGNAAAHDQRHAKGDEPSPFFLQRGPESNIDSFNHDATSRYFIINTCNPG